MKQLSHRSKQSFDLSFQKKSTALSLVIVASAAAYFAANAFPMRASATDGIPTGYGALVVGTVALIIIAQIVLQIVLVFGAGSAPAASVGEKSAEFKSYRNAFYVLVTGIVAGVGAYFLDQFTPFDTVNIIILALAAAEIVRATTQLITHH